MADFTDIGIVGLDPKKTTWSRVHSSMRNNARCSARATIESMPAELPAIVDPANGADFDNRHNEWRARFRAALTTRAKEPDRGND